MLIKWLIGSAAMLLTAYIVPGITVESIFTALILALVWGLISYTIKPVLHIIAIPITVVTLGFFSLVINALLFWFMATFVKGFYIDGFLSAFIGAFLVSFFTWIGQKIFVSDD